MSDMPGDFHSLVLFGHRGPPRSGAIRATTTGGALAPLTYQYKFTFVDANGVPEYAYVNYRLRARSVGKLAPRVAKTSYSTGDQTPSIST